MTDDEFDRSLVSAAFTLAHDRGWGEVSVVRAAREASLPLDRARARFLGRGHILARFGRIADQSALAAATLDGSPRDRLFDLLMRRFDVLQAHRGGVLALKSFLPRNPMLSLSLGAAHLVSMAFMLEAAGIPASGLRGAARTQGLLAVWMRTARAWERDESEDLTATMAALDAALDRAASAERWMRWDTGDAASEPPVDMGSDLTVAEGMAAEGVVETSEEPPFPPIANSDIEPEAPPSPELGGGIDEPPVR